MDKKCKNCNQEFTPINYRGSEQVYCSVKCRNMASIKRHKEYSSGFNKTPCKLRSAGYFDYM